MQGARNQAIASARITNRAENNKAALQTNRRRLEVSGTRTSDAGTPRRLARVLSQSAIGFVKVIVDMRSGKADTIGNLLIGTSSGGNLDLPFLLDQSDFCMRRWVFAFCNERLSLLMPLADESFNEYRIHGRLPRQGRSRRWTVSAVG